MRRRRPGPGGADSPPSSDRFGVRPFTVVSLLALLMNTGCGVEPASGERRDVVDGLGRTVSIPADPRRIVSLAPNVTDTLFALGFGDRIVGITNFCSPPAGTRSIASVGGMLNPSLEAIRQLHPDLLVATTSGNDPGLDSQAAALDLPLYTIHTPNIEGTMQSISSLADALGRKDRGAQVVSDLRRRIEDVRSRVAGRRSPRVLYLIWGDPLVVPGGPAFVTDALKSAGADLVTAGAPTAWPTYSLEAVLADAPEVILTTSKNRDLAERMPTDPAWSSLPAVRMGRVHIVSDAIEKPGPHAVAGIEEVARVLYPGLYDESQVTWPENE